MAKPTDPTARLIDAGEIAVRFAQDTRALHARRTPKDSKQRQADIETALERLKAAMKPIKSELGRFPYGPQTQAAEARYEAVKAVSAAIQRERRKLWKMR